MTEERTKIEIETSLGKIIVELYNDTPQHRDNFIKLVKEEFYDDLLFHRVIKDFMIQGGDPESKGAPVTKSLGSGGPGYNIPAEIVYPARFHKRGVLSAARQGDEINPAKESSGSQFYIVWGKPLTDGRLDMQEEQMEKSLQRKLFNELAMKHRSEIMQLRKAKDTDALMDLQDELVRQANEEMTNRGPVRFTPEQREAYKGMGGTPHLDGEYTVFGEVVVGLDVVAKIQEVSTGQSDRPKENITMKMKIVES